MKIMSHTVKILAISTIASILMLFPFFPGNFDSFSVAISSVIQLSAFMSLPLVILGVIWLVYALKSNKKRSFVFAVIALIFASIMVIGVCAAAYGGVYSYRGSALLALSLLFCYVYVVIRKMLPRINRMANNPSAKVNPIVFYMIIIPLLLMSVRLLFFAPLVAFSRETAIQNSETLIADIEKYYTERGEYPVTLQGLWKDYDTGVVGIERYYYARNGEAFNIFFENIAANLATREIVMYNKHDEQNIRSHPSFIFRLTEEQWHNYRGFYAEHPLPFAHWKYFLFD